MSYFVIHCDEDGDISVIRYKAACDLLADFTPDENGFCYYGPSYEVKFSEKLPVSYYSTNEYTIIKGEIVVPEHDLIVKLKIE